ncbi:MAG: type VI secretion system baseplate subunit TssF [Planctomycetes bacterium]|nr:type VI secretion system baseplate subunit TssF [Planctomycetota bacterium]
MSEELLPYYNRELAFIRRLGAEFAEAHPKIAGRLRLGPDTAEDPHVERIIEAFAYLNARTRHKLEDDFPELTDALLGVLYPHYQAPVPAMSVVRFVLDRGEGDLTTGYTIPVDSPMETDPIDGKPCRFRTSYPVTLWPIELKSADLTGRPFAAPATPFSADAAAVLRLELECFSGEMTFAKLQTDSLRFFLKGQAQHVFALYELLFNNTLGVALARSPRDTEPVILEPECIRPVGFDADEGLLPYPPRSFLGYRLLSEFFTFCEKFLFFDLADLDPRVLPDEGNKLAVFIYLSESSTDLEQNVTSDVFQLGCTPVVNLYRRRAEPITLTHARTEYRVVPDARRPGASEIHSIDRVTATSPDNQTVEYRPFYSFKHAVEGDQASKFWHATRRRVGGPGQQMTEMYLSLVDLEFQSSAPADWTLDVETTCLDADLPHRLPFGKGQPRLRLEGGAPLEAIECLTRPTQAFRPALKHGALWKLISHLSLNHLSLVDYEEGADALREILKLYDFADSAETRSMIDGVQSVVSRRIVGRSGGGSGFCRGVEVTVQFDEERFAGSGLFLFASVLERFLGLYCTINSFTRLVATTNRREGALRRWSPRAGTAVLL